MSASRPVSGDARATPVDASAPGVARWLLPVAAAGALLAIALRIFAFVVVGPLWRDEAGSASTATASTFTEFLARQHQDSFPLLWQLLLRFWTTVLWDGSDLAIRTLGLLVAIALVPALWWTCRSLRVLPLASLLFAGVAPTFVLWAGIQNRAYGLSVVLLALLIGAVWRVVEAPTVRRVALAALVAVLAVHTSYQSPAMLVALLGAAALVGLLRRAWTVVASAAGVGIVAALSLLIYVGVLERTRELAKMVYAKVGVTSVVLGIERAFAPGGAFVVWAFVVLALVACVVGVLAALRLATRPRPPVRAVVSDTDDALTFAGAAAILALLCQAVFLLTLRFPVQPWYYVTVVLVVAVAIDVVVQRGIPVRVVREGVAAVLAVLIAVSSAFAVGALDRRQSNLDLVAAYLKANARPGDLIVVYPWHYGVSFDRYYDGAVPFMTVPAVEEHDYHRFDQLKQLMLDPELLKPGYRRIYQTLKAGNGVWVVGRPASEVPAEFPILPPPRDEDPDSWRDGFYTAVAGMQLGWVLNQSSPQAFAVPPLTEKRISEYEDSPITLFSVQPR